VIAYLRRDKTTQPLPLFTLGKHLVEITYPSNNSIPANIKFSDQHIDTVVLGLLLPQSRDDQNCRPPVNLSSQKQTGWRQHPAPTIFSAATEAQADEVFFWYIVRATSRLSGIGGVMKRGTAKGTPGMPACEGHILVYMVKYTKKTDVLKKF